MKQNLIFTFGAFVLLQLPHFAYAYETENLCSRILEDFMKQNNIGGAMDGVSSLMNNTSPLNKVSSLVDRKTEPLKDVRTSGKELEAEKKSIQARIEGLDIQLNDVNKRYFGYSKNLKGIDVLDSSLPNKGYSTFHIPESFDRSAYQKLWKSYDEIGATLKYLMCDSSSEKGCLDLKKSQAEARDKLDAEVVKIKKAAVEIKKLTPEQEMSYSKEKQALADQQTLLYNELRSVEQDLRKDADFGLSGFVAKFPLEEYGNFRVTSLQMKKSINPESAARLAELKKKRASLEIAESSAEESRSRIEKERKALGFDEYGLQMIVKDSSLPESTRKLASEKLKKLAKLSNDQFTFSSIKSDAKQELEVRTNGLNKQIQDLEQPLLDVQVLHDSKNKIVGIYFASPHFVSMTNECKKIKIEDEVVSGQLEKRSITTSVIKMFGVSDENKLREIVDRDKAPGGDLAKYMQWAKEDKTPSVLENVPVLNKSNNPLRAK